MDDGRTFFAALGAFIIVGYGMMLLLEKCFTSEPDPYVCEEDDTDEYFYKPDQDKIK
jgi:hypothetical protein